MVRTHASDECGSESAKGHVASSGVTPTPRETSEIQLLLQYRPRDTARFVASLDGGLVIEHVLDTPEQLQVLNRNDRGDTLPAPVDHNAFAVVDDSLQGSEKLFRNLVCRDPCHADTACLIQLEDTTFGFA